MSDSVVQFSFGFLDLDNVSLVRAALDRKSGERVVLAWLAGDPQPMLFDDLANCRLVWSAMRGRAGKWSTADAIKQTEMDIRDLDAVWEKLEMDYKEMKTKEDAKKQADGPKSWVRLPPAY